MNTDTKTKEGKQSPPEKGTSAAYTLHDIGCYVDGARGIYAIDAIVDIAESRGALLGDPDPKDVKPMFENSRFAGYEFANEVEEDCNNYMEKVYGVNGAYWGRNENGDWGLWSTEEEE